MFWNPKTQESTPLFQEKKPRGRIEVLGPTYPTCSVCGSTQHELISFRHKDAELSSQHAVYFSPRNICRLCLQKALDIKSLALCEKCGR